MVMLKTVFAAGLIALAAATANAATVDFAGTTAGGGGFALTSGSTIVGVDHPNYNHDSTPVASNWVWAEDQNENPLTFAWTFDLTGYDLSSAVLSGFWGVDNNGEVLLNGNLISSLSGTVVSSFNTLTPLTALNSFFLSGVNTLLFNVENAGTYSSGNPAAFRASVSVDATPSAVPIPATLPLLAGALAAFGMVSSRRKRRAA